MVQTKNKLYFFDNLILKGSKKNFLNSALEKNKKLNFIFRFKSIKYFC